MQAPKVAWTPPSPPPPAISAPGLQAFVLINYNDTVHSRRLHKNCLEKHQLLRKNTQVIWRYCGRLYDVIVVVQECKGNVFFLQTKGPWKD